MREQRDTELGVSIRSVFDRVEAVTADEARAVEAPPTAGRRRSAAVLGVLLVLGVVLAGVAVWRSGAVSSGQPVAVGAAVGEGRATPDGWWSGPARQDPLYEDLRFREMFGLSMDRGHIERVREDWDEQASLLPIALTHEESEAVEERMALSDVFTAAEPRIEGLAGAGYSGAELELHRDVVVVRFQEGSPELDSEEFREEVSGLLPEGLAVQVLEAEFTVEELTAYSEEISASMEWLEAQGVDIVSHGVEQASNRVAVRVRPGRPVEDILGGLVPVEALDIFYLHGCTVRGPTLGWEQWERCAGKVP